MIITPFSTAIKNAQIQLTRTSIETIQINLGKLCNQACSHCHVDASPMRKEIMEEATIDRIIELMTVSRKNIKTVDITGGAPEMNPHFRKLVTAARALNFDVIDRCNLTIFFEPGHEDLPNFLAENKIRIIASLPCYTKTNVDKQRGHGVFEKSIKAIEILNKLGYGIEGKELKLDLAYNPGGVFLPGNQINLEADYKKELATHFNLKFNELFTITNMPINRFLSDLQKQGKHQEYMELLASNFNRDAAQKVMCKSLVSISWNGWIYDCDFNQMLEIPINNKKTSLWDINSFDELSQNPIAMANHCYGCTAGAGSSCTGALKAEA